MEEIKTVKMDKLEETELAEVSEKEGLLVKAKAGVKKHWKKIAAGAAIGASVLIGYALGSKSGSDDYEAEEDDEDNIIDIDDYSEKETE